MLWKGSAARRRLVRWCCLGHEQSNFRSNEISCLGRVQTLSALHLVCNTNTSLLDFESTQGAKICRFQFCKASGFLEIACSPLPLFPRLFQAQIENGSTPPLTLLPRPPPRPLENTLLKTALLGTWSSIEGQLCKTSWSVATLRHNSATTNCRVSPSLSQYASRRFFSDQIDAFVTSLQCSVHYHRGTLCLEK